MAYTLDVSPKGARLAGVTGLKSLGQLIAVRRKADEARFRVVWIGRPRTPQEGQIGIECVDPDKVIWDVDFAKAQEDFEPIGTASLGSGRVSKSSAPTGTQSEDYSCLGMARVWAEEVDPRCMEAWLTRIGLSGCQLENAARIPFHGQLVLHLHIGETQLTVKGTRCKTDLASDAWIEFTHIRRGDRLVLQALISLLSKRRRHEIKNQPVEELSGPDHLCLLYTSREEQLAAVIPFVREGLTRGERCIYIADEDSAGMMDAFRAAGIPVDDAVKSGAIQILTKRDAYLKTGDFDPQWMLQFVQDQVTAARAAGFAGLRATGETSWIQTKPQAEKFLEYEAKLNEIIPGTGLLAMCQYHRNRVGPDMITGILNAHPQIVISDGIQQNSAYRRLGGYAAGQ